MRSLPSPTIHNLRLGIDESAKVFLVALGVFFPVYVNTLHGVRSVDPGLIEMARVFHLSRWELFRKVIFPGAIPSVLVGVRFGLGVMWLTLIVAETIGAELELAKAGARATDNRWIDLALSCLQGCGQMIAGAPQQAAASFDEADGTARALGAPDSVLRFVDDGLLSTMERAPEICRFTTVTPTRRYWASRRCSGFGR